MKLQDKFGHVAALRPATPVSNANLPAGADELARLLGAEPVRNRFGEHLRMRNWFADPAQCAAPNGALDLLLPPMQERPAGARRGAANVRRERAAERAFAADPEKWLFLDTETTGLAGGTGTYAFLVGLAWWDAGGLQCEQLFLRDFTEEHSLLMALAERIAERPVLITFNGKTFDWPLLETRYRMTRAISLPALAAHLDFLHPARALWRLRWGSVRLAELERNVLSCCTPRIGWTREGDVRGELIPQIYFDYLRGASPVALLDVLRHNQMDLRGLAALAGRVITLLNEPELADGDGYELFGVSRIVKQRAPQHPRKAHDLFALALEAGLPGGIRARARWEMALLARRERDYERAAAIWKELAEMENDGVEDPEASPMIQLEALEQLAIYYERRQRDPWRALECANRGLSELKKVQRAYATNAAPFARLRYRLYERVARLERRLGNLLQPSLKADA